LADPNFNIPGQIDILLGAELSYSIFNGQKYPLSDCAILHHTTLGWVLAGKAFLSSEIASYYNSARLVESYIDIFRMCL